MFRALCFAALSVVAGSQAVQSHERTSAVGNGKSVGFTAFIGQKSHKVVAPLRLETRPVKAASNTRKPQPCSAAQAEIVARELGIRFQTVHNKKYVIKVAGYRQGRPASVKISRAPGCFVIE